MISGAIKYLTQSTWSHAAVFIGAICSTLIAQAFQSVNYPILPHLTQRDAARPGCPDCQEEVLHIRHHSLFAPRDFDLSPYFEIVKPLLEHEFDYRALIWGDAESAAKTA